MLARSFLRFAAQPGLQLARGLTLSLCLGFLGTAVRAEPGGDHPEVPRYPGAVMKAYDLKDYEEAQLFLSRPVLRGSEYTADKLLPLEGRVTFIRYEMSNTVSALQIFRNYQSVLRRSGFKELFSCDRPCSTYNLSNLRKTMKLERVSLSGDTDNQYLAAQRGNTYVSLWVNVYGGDPQAWLTVVEKGSLDTELMAVSGDSPMARALSEQGRVDVYGFQFDTGKSQLKPESQSSLKELGRVLQDNPQLKIALVGHTDDVGGPEANLKLSEARARAVAEALSVSAGIAAERLSSRGAGQSQPVAANSDETGRAKNRRVEIIASVPNGATANTAFGAVGANTNARPSASANPSAARPAPGAPSASKAEPAKPVAEEANSAIDSANKLLDTANKLRGLFGR
ncbi:OmpA family protein [Paucibacter sp. Y2R2-4]|uniref:OmpA family protein n=1 Tax=Paucibacter sp. Y2R2-4 TaxID=2893553 RepID=UPI0021E43889|nr:OmpA family protein [Paucibacter sp. Y2R2-4]MCV2351436.1 OmpA family protein [Paucibacter sp. Y2R2-4]